DDFLNSLIKVKEKQQRLSTKTLNVAARKKIISQFKNAPSRTLFLDYDGTLVPFADHPANASPGKGLLNVLEKISRLKKTEIIIISGRDRHTIEKWFGHL